MKWLQNKTGIFVTIKNTGKTATLQVGMNSYQKAKNTTAELTSLQDFTTLNKLEKQAVVLEPGVSAQFRFSDADAFEIESKPVKARPEEGQSVIKNVKRIMRRYFKSEGTIKASHREIGTGVRG